MLAGAGRMMHTITDGKTGENANAVEKRRDRE